MNFYLKKIALGTCLSLSLVSNSIGQEMISDTTSLDDVFSMSLEELMNSTIISASRKEESAFDSPLSSFIISKKEISAMGDHEVGTIKSNFLLNANVNYLVAENMTAFVNVRNLTNQTAAQGFGSDRLGINFLVGLKINY